MSNLPPVELKLCPECGAAMAVTAQVCWLCRRDVPVTGDLVMAELAPEPQRTDVVEIILAITTVVIVAVIALVGVGCFVTAPGLGIAYSLFAAPPLIITLIRTQRQKATTGKTSWADRLLTLLLSTGLTVLVAMLLMFAAFIAFFIWCWYMILSGGS